MRTGPVSGGRSPELLGRFEKVAQLPEEENNTVLLLDSVIAKHTIRKVMGS